MSSINILLYILAYFLVLIIIAKLSSKSNSNDSFYLGSRKSPWFIVAFGMIGASLSGVTFISVPGWVGTQGFSYFQMVLGYFFGYLVITHILLPIYYKMNLISIYSYLENRFGYYSYKVGAICFFTSRVIGASVRLFLVANVLQLLVFDTWNVPFFITVFLTIAFIWIYTNKGGISTIIWTDTLQTLFMLLAVGFSFYFIKENLSWTWMEAFEQIKISKYSQVFHFSDWKSDNYFWKQFISGAFITIVMTGLDQDMMQKNLSCKNIKDAKKNMFWFSFILIFVNLLFLALGAILFIYSDVNNIIIPERTDNLFPFIAMNGNLGSIVSITFILGLIAAAYSSADSALTSLTTTFSIDIIGDKKLTEEGKIEQRKKIHVLISALIFVVILVFNYINKESVIHIILKMAGYTYGPLLGLYFIGIFTKLKFKEKLVPIVAILSPILSFLVSYYSFILLDGYKMSYELLIINGLFMIIGLFIIRNKDE